jgi:predicted HTH domain antitoxin
MGKTTVVRLDLSPDLAAAIRAHGCVGQTDEERVRIPLAVGLFVEGAISLAKAAELAGQSRYAFAMMLKARGVPAYVYTQTEYEQDIAFLSSVME